MRKFGLIGYPLTHSFSCKYFTEKFLREHRTDCAYDNYPLVSIELLPSLIEKETEIKGLNVTIPYKESVKPFLNELDDTAAFVGAVNCIDITSNIYKGYNTDVIGFELSLKPLLKAHHRQALILGTGGASKAVAYVLSKLGIAYKLVSRNRSGDYWIYDDLDKEIIQEHTVIINTTPLGTSPDIFSIPDIPYQFLSSEHLLYDLVYNPAETVFLQKGKEQGATIKNGYEMLELQAEASWKIWNNQ